MLVKNFEGFSMADAMKAVKSEFGGSAVILSTNERLDEKTGEKIVEVKAAAPQNDSPGASAATFTNLDLLENHIDSLNTSLLDMKKDMVKESHAHTLETGLQEIKLLLLESLRNKEGNIDRDLPKDLLDLAQHLKVMGVEESHCTELMNHLASIPYSDVEDNSVERRDFYKSHAIRWMHKRIKIAPPWKITKGNTSIHMLVGPSGSGKTSLIAKIAAFFKKEKEANILVVSYDNKRIAASEQLKIYSKILGFNFASIESSSELESLLLKNRNYDLVLIDTAGCNPRSEEDINDLRSFRECGIPVDTHLILSLTEKQNQMDKAIRSFSSLRLNSLLFSKLDESWTYGEIYNMAQKWSLPLGYFSTGQKIPRAFERASRERVLERIFCL